MTEYQFPSSITSNNPTSPTIASFHSELTNNSVHFNSNSNSSQLQQSQSISSSIVSSSSQSTNHSAKRSISECNNVALRIDDDEEPPVKKRKKNGTTHSKLIEEFAQRSHIRNSVHLSSYHGKKQNIKTLCPYHDMLPVINIMEKEVFNDEKDVNIKKEYCNLLPIIRNECEWCCSGSPYKVECRNLLMRVKRLYEYHFNFNDIVLPFMNAAVLGGPNPNICIKLNTNTNTPKQLTFKPLQNLSLIERNDTCNIALKAISCGTFKRNLQPVPDACRITKLLDGDGCFININNNNIFFKVSSSEVRQRRKLQGTDSILGVGFDCASRLSWQKPRIYWMHQSIHTLRDKKSKKIVQKKHISNRDLRFSILIPYDFKGSITIYLIGIQHDRQYTMNTSTNIKSDDDTPPTNTTNTTNTVQYPVIYDADKSKYIDNDLENGRNNYIDLLHSINFENENYQTSASQWIRICIHRYHDNDDIYHNYLLNLVQSLSNSIGDDKTVRGLKRAWMSYNNIENEWSFLHMICSKNLLYLFQSIVNLLINYKHELLIATANTQKESKMRISPLHCCIINNNHQFTKYLFDYYLNKLTSPDILNILQNDLNSNNSLITHLINHNHTQTLQQLINVNATRTNQFLTIQHVQLILHQIQKQQQLTIMDGAYSVI